jgi:hypothetical protein
MKQSAIMTPVLVLALTACAAAGNNPQAKVAIHVRAHNATAGCDYGTIDTCEDIVYQIDSDSFDAFPVFFDLNEFLGCEYGLIWPGTWSSAVFTSCSDFVIGGITSPGEGASHTWAECQSGVCVPSFVWIYASGPGQICPVANPSSGALKVLDCEEGVDSLLQGGHCAGVYGAEGEDPCLPVNITPTTWGAIKSMFE